MYVFCFLCLQIQQIIFQKEHRLTFNVFFTFCDCTSLFCACFKYQRICIHAVFFIEKLQRNSFSIFLFQWYMYRVKLILLHVIDIFTCMKCSIYYHVFDAESGYTYRGKFKIKNVTKRTVLLSDAIKQYLFFKINKMISRNIICCYLIKMFYECRTRNQTVEGRCKA